MKPTFTNVLCVILFGVSLGYCQDEILDPSTIEPGSYALNLDVDEVRLLGPLEASFALTAEGQIIEERAEAEPIWRLEIREPDETEVIREDAEQKFEQRQKTMRRQLERLRARLDNLDERIGAQEDNREAIIKEYVRRMMETKLRSKREALQHLPEPENDQMQRAPSHEDSPQTKLLMLNVQQAELNYERANVEYVRLQKAEERTHGVITKKELRDAKLTAQTAEIEVERAKLKLEMSKSQPTEYELIDLYKSHPKYAELSLQIDEYDSMSEQLRPGSPDLKQCMAEVARLRTRREKLEKELRPRMIERLRSRDDRTSSVRDHDREVAEDILPEDELDQPDHLDFDPT